MSTNEIIIRSIDLETKQHIVMEGIFRELQITLVSAENIGPNRRHSIAVKAYAEISLNGDPGSAVITKVDMEGGANPKWNKAFIYKIKESYVWEPGLDVVVKLYYNMAKLDRFKFVGEVKISVRELYQNSGINAAAVSYHVAGTETGKLNISYRFGNMMSAGKPTEPGTRSTSKRPFNLPSIQDSSSSLTPKPSDLHSIQASSEYNKEPSFREPITEAEKDEDQDEEIEDESENEGESMFQSGREIKEMNDEVWLKYFKDFIMFCSVFPLDYEFTKDVLVWQWIGGRLIELREDEEMEEVGTKRFNTLLGMDYIQPSGYDYVLDQTKYKIGDKMTTFIQEQRLEQSHHDPIKVELLSIMTFKELEVLKQYTHLQTLVIQDCYEVDYLPSDVFSELKTLKILNLSRTNIVELPSSVENLKELLFIDMSETPLVWLPESICSLNHLQTLKLDGCLQLEGLPKGTSKLINLRHLILDVVRQLESMPVGIGKLSNLRTLIAFLVGKKEGCSVRELTDMNKLRGSFRLLNLENVKTKEEASEACLHKKVELRKIVFQWSDVEDEKIPHEEEILESLKPGVGIQELKIMFYSGGVLPSWIYDPSFKELVTIFLSNCRYCISLPSLGELPSLKHLSIIGNKEVVEIDSSFCRKQRNQYHPAFPKLEKLTFESMSILEKWTGLERIDFPSLSHLIIEYCPEFVELPYLLLLNSLSHLEIRYCPKLSLLPCDKLPPSLQSLMIKESPRLKEWCCDENWSKIASVPTVYFDHHKFSPEM